MKFKMAENSLFAVLLRAQWWVSVLVAFGSFMALRLIVPEVYAFFGSLPFVVIAAVATWKQLRAPSAAKIAAGLEALRAMSWEAFSRALEEGFRREGYSVKRVEGAADFELEKAGRMSLVCARRWKASSRWRRTACSRRAATRATTTTGATCNRTSTRQSCAPTC